MEKQYCNLPEIWGGIECTINRVNEHFFDQLNYSGHYNRSSDIKHIAELNIKKLRFPLLWEKHQPVKDQPVDWTWADQQLAEAKNNGIDIIAGLVHHGSGPAYTNLLDPLFPELFANYAKQVAEKFPWIEYYTPINEPLTTARFSGLYGLWYPHKNNARDFLIMLLHELKATVLAMQAIRNVNPNAKLVQTDDLGKTYSTPALKYQADFENERRWLTFDILNGTFNRHHLLYHYFIENNIPESDLNFFLNNPCPPDIFGFNHYLTSERYLDEKTELYPSHTHGGNGRHRYADVEAVRVEVNVESGLSVLLRESWERYKKPIAITEVHLHCHREDQVKWFREVYEICRKEIQNGIDIKAVTSWALLGSFGWNKLLTEPGGEYEPGAFDVRSGNPRPTALAKFIKQFAIEKEECHSIFRTEGWWQRSSRILYGKNKSIVIKQKNHKQPLLIFGKNGTLGKAFARICESRHIAYHLVSRQECDISDPDSVEAVFKNYQPWAAINAAGYVRVDDAEIEKNKCFLDNFQGPVVLAKKALETSVRLMNFSSDLVFDGTKDHPYLESDPVLPLNVYGKSKAAAEKEVNAINSSALMIRTSAFFGPWDEYNFAHYVKKAAELGELIKVADDEFIAPTYVPDLVNASLDLLIDGESGIWHLANKGCISWYMFAIKIAEKLGFDSSFLKPVKGFTLGRAAKRPCFSVLGTEKGHLLPTLEDALDRYCTNMKSNNSLVAMIA